LGLLYSSSLAELSEISNQAILKLRIGSLKRVRSQLNICISRDRAQKIPAHRQKTGIMLNVLWQYFGSSEKLTLKQQLINLQRRVAQLKTLVRMDS
jgi:hypothetical protein